LPAISLTPDALATAVAVGAADVVGVVVGRVVVVMPAPDLTIYGFYG
jgi:hypothetical protein